MFDPLYGAPTDQSTRVARIAKARLIILPGGTDVAGGQRYVDRVRKMSQEVYAALSR